MSDNTALTPADFEAYVNAGDLESHDLFGVQELLAMAKSTAPKLAWIALALALRSSRDGHTCIDLGSIDNWRGEISHVDGNSPFWPTDPEEWMKALSQVPTLVRPPATAMQEPRAPFIIDGWLLYTARVHHEEERVAAMLKGERGLQVQVVLGGPGAGKTTWVANELMQRLSAGEQPSVALAAPTGKAARRMVQVLESTLVKSNAAPHLVEAVRNSESLTVHKLLGYNPSKPKRVSHDVNKPLERQLIIVDEASMLSLNSMSKLLDAMPTNGTLWLVGDPDQLASVEAGTVLADIAAGRNVQQFIKRLTGQHRFEAASPIGRLVEQVRLADVDAVMDIVRTGGANFTWIDPQKNPDALRELQGHVVNHAREVCTTAKSGDIDAAVGLNLSLQVLSGVRKGPLGVWDWNRLVEENLGDLSSERWYIGRPVLVTQNDSATSLSNGDVGVVCRGKNNERLVAFGEPGTVRTFAPTRLPDVDTVHALTIHKSQGSEYEHAVVVLPDSGTRILTRELLYTGISRPKKQLTLVATEQAIREAVSQPVRRATGLAGRL